MSRKVRPLEAIEAFLAVAEAGGVRAGAATLSLSPSATSRRIAALEAFLDIDLFNRSNGGLQLTAAGMTYRNAAEAAIEADGWSARPWGTRYQLVEKPMDRTDLDRLTREARALMRAQAEAESAPGCGADGADGDGSQQPDANGWLLEIQTNHAEHVSMAETSGANE